MLTPLCKRSGVAELEKVALPIDDGAYGFGLNTVAGTPSAFIQVMVEASDELAITERFDQSELEIKRPTDKIFLSMSSPA